MIIFPIKENTHLMGIPIFRHTHIVVAGCPMIFPLNPIKSIMLMVTVNPHENPP